jgi:plastocyanin
LLATCLVLGVALGVAACDDDEADNGTPTEPEATEAATQPDATEAATEPGATPGDGVTLEISASDSLSFNVDTLEVAAGEPFSVTFDNQDTGVQHNFALYESEDEAHGGGDPIAATDLAPGPDVQTVEVPALDAGEYYFHCDVHPNMNGTLTAE